MKKINIILAIAAAALTVSCEKEIDFGGKVGTPIRFGAATGYDNGPETRTEYSGRDESNRLVQSTSQYERIDWVANTDRISILCNEVPGSTKILDYKITSASASNEKSKADVEPAGEQFNWGSGEHYFFAMYPAPTQDHVTAGEAVLNDHGNHTVTISGKIPATQEVTLSGREYKANMNYAYMYAAKKVDSPESNVELGFKPLVTAFEFTLLADNTFPITSNLTKVQLSASTELAGNFVATIDENGFTGNPTTSNVSTTLTLNLGTGIQLSKTDPVKFTFLALPKDQTGLKLMLTFASGETRSLELKKNSGFITVDACKKVYIRSVGVIAEIEYIFDATGPSFSTFIPTDGSRPVNWSVTSYARSRSNPSDTKPVKWDVIEYSVNNGPWSSTRPNWFTLQKYSDNGSGSYTASANANTQSVTWIGSETAIGSKSQPIDLSMRTIKGEPLSARSTANCYVVSAPGWYRIPVVYGNALKNGSDNTEAYKTGNSASNMLNNFVRHDDKPISKPWIDDNSGVTSNNAVLCWQDCENVVSDVSLETYDNHKFIRFQVSNITNGNAIVAVRNSDGTILWSWHIWIVPDTKLNNVTITNNDDKSFDVLTLNLGWYDSTIPARTVRIRVKQQESGLIDEFDVQQESADLFGGNVYYQWGRKDPMLGFTDSFGEKQQYVSDESLRFRGHDVELTPITHDVTITRDWGFFGSNHTAKYTYKHYDGMKTTTIGDAIKNPYYFYQHAGSITVITGAHWNTNDYTWSEPYGIDETETHSVYEFYAYRWCGTLYHNLWNANAVEDNSENTTVTKTVYDPCPVGYKVPPTQAFNALPHNEINKKGMWAVGLFFPATELREYDNSKVRNKYAGIYMYTAGHTWHRNNQFICGTYFEARDTGQFSPEWSDGADTYGFPVRPVADN